MAYEKILTISIAAYNIEKYICHTLDSFIIPKILDRIEVIIVNDGSKDNTSELAHYYEKQYPDTFVVIDKENGGYGSTINSAVEAARGKYFKTVDGDDWVDGDGFADLVDYLEKCADDVVVTDYSRVSDKNGNIIPTRFACDRHGISMRFDEIYKDHELYMQALTFKTTILKKAKLRINHHCFYTDIEYILTPVPFIETCSFLNVNVYMYRIAVAEQSMSVVGQRKHIDEQLKIFNKMLNYYQDYKVSLSAAQKGLFKVILSGMMKSHITAILSLKTTYRSYCRLKKFDMDSLKEESSICLYANRFKVVKLLRNSHYSLYWLGSPCYKIYKRVLSMLGR